MPAWPGSPPTVARGGPGPLVDRGLAGRPRRGALLPGSSPPAAPPEIDARFDVGRADAHAGVASQVPVDTGRPYRIRAAVRGSLGAVLELNDRSRGDRPIIHAAPREQEAREVSVAYRPSGPLLRLYACLTSHGGNPPGWIEVERLRIEPEDGSGASPLPGSREAAAAPRGGSAPPGARSAAPGRRPRRPASFRAGPTAGIPAEAARSSASCAEPTTRRPWASPAGGPSRRGSHGVYGAVFPRSARYRTYLEHREILRRQRPAPPPAGERPIPSAGPGGPRPADVLVFPVIDWHFRLQRPQHLARQLAGRGHRVFYFSTGFVRGARTGAPSPGSPRRTSAWSPCPSPQPRPTSTATGWSRRRSPRWRLPWSRSGSGSGSGPPSPWWTIPSGGRSSSGSPTTARSTTAWTTTRASRTRGPP